MNEEVTKRVRELFGQLKKEEKGHIYPGSTTLQVPNPSAYVHIADAILALAQQQYDLDDPICDLSLLEEYFRDEVYAVRNFHGEYQKGSFRLTPQSRLALENYMNKATKAIERAFVGNITFE